MAYNIFNKTSAIRILSYILAFVISFAFITSSVYLIFYRKQSGNNANDIKRDIDILKNDKMTYHIDECGRDLIPESVDKISAYGKEAMPELIILLYDERPSLRYWALQIINNINYKHNISEIICELEAGLKRESEIDVKEMYIIVLSYIQDKNAIDVVVNNLQDNDTLWCTVIVIQRLTENMFGDTPPIMRRTQREDQRLLEMSEEIMAWWKYYRDKAEWKDRNTLKIK